MDDRAENSAPRPTRALTPRAWTLLIAAASAALALGACGAAASSSSTVTRPPATPTVQAASSAPAALDTGVIEPACGAATAEVAATTANVAAQHIYALELHSTEVSADRRQIEGYAPLLAALTAGNDAGVLGAVTSLVYSHTHVVRLRVTQGSRVVADVGGPYIIAPVVGTLRQGGRVVGRYAFSVQDDLGYVKLESRYVGLPLILRRGATRVPLEGTLPDAGLPSSGPLDYHGGAYEATSFNALAFPSGSLRITLLDPRPRSTAAGCRAVRLAELARIDEHVWARFMSVGAPASAYVIAVRGLTGALVYVRAGSRPIAGASSPGPAHIPDSGTVRYRGRTYVVASFPSSTAGANVRVYELLIA